jgi:hypothetical protein
MITVGDMMLTPEQHADLFANSSMRRHGLAGHIRRWPRGIVPVVFENGFDAAYVAMIKSAMRYIMKHSCVMFDWQDKPRKDYVLIKPGNQCASLVSLTSSLLE